MAKPHAQRISIATGLDIEEVRSFLDFNADLGCEFESTASAIAAIEWDQQVNRAFNSDLSFDHAMGKILGGMD